MRSSRAHNLQKGFTLIELLVIISIIAFLAAAILTALSLARSKGRDTKRVADVKQMINALDLFLANCNSFPIASSLVLDSTKQLYTGTSCGTLTGTSGNGGFGTTPSGNVLVNPLKSSPLPPDSSTCATGTNNSYIYNSAAGTSYTLTFCLGQAIGGYSAGINTVTR